MSEDRALRWLPVARLADLAEGEGREVVVEDRIVALYLVAGRVHALDGICPHQGGPLAKGRLQGCIVTCPWHGWQFDVTSGQHQFNATIRQPCLPTRIAGEMVQVGLED